MEEVLKAQPKLLFIWMLIMIGSYLELKLEKLNCQILTLNFQLQLEESQHPQDMDIMRQLPLQLLLLLQQLKEHSLLNRELILDMNNQDKHNNTMMLQEILKPDNQIMRQDQESMILFMILVYLLRKESKERED